MQDFTRALLGCSLSAMRLMPANAYDLAIVDPPYHIIAHTARAKIGHRIDKTGKMNDWNHKKPTGEYFEQLFRVSKKQIIWGANNFDLPESEYFIVWNKSQTVDNFASAEYAWTSVQKPAKIFHFSIHQHNLTKGEKIHPTMKPIALYKWLLTHYAQPGDKILDTHLGSGTARIAAYDLGFRFDGWEIDRDYFQDQERKFAEHKSQMQLFKQVPLLPRESFTQQRLIL